ncbi:MAG TPA: hypothetical protein VFP31_07195 [Gaiellaceae bacterium]|nr:hypothetical protein [Gaiellaceae bacterium]
MSRARRRRSSQGGTAVRVLVVLAAFVIGIAVGAALDNGPDPGTTTFDRTLRIVTVTSTR